MRNTATPETAPIRVAVVDDHAIFRSGVAAILAAQPDLVVVAEAADGVAAVSLYEVERPDVMLVDLRMPRMEGVEVVSRVLAAHPQAALVILTTYDADEDIHRALRAGARGFLLKDVPPRELVACVRAVHAGRRWVPPEVAAKLVAHLTAVDLTPREYDTLHLLATGRGNKEIAADLGVGIETVKAHVRSLFRKLQVTTRAEAIAAAARRGLVRLE